jgi:hypothetical protein
METMSSRPADNSPCPIKLKLDKKYQPSPVAEGDEIYPNGIFHFNISRLLAFIDAHPSDFPVEALPVADIPDYGGSPLNEAAVRSADLSRPVLLAEIAPGRYNLIDGHHRVAKARRDGVPTVHARRIPCPRHVPFLTTTEAYEKYVEYWNSKVKEMRVGHCHSSTVSATS